MAVSGVAGSVRIKQLSAAGLTLAEKHGKRQDKTSRARMITNDPPITSTGLHLCDLHRAHVAGAFAPEAKSKAMHMIVQFPKALVDGEEGELLLSAARAFAENVFGEQAIFADRVDRDEKGRHVVDLFIAPRYVKRTKHSEKVAISMTRHLKALAKKHQRPPTPHGTGRALQDEFYAYLRTEMSLEGVMRGEPKPYGGDDWKSAEELALEDLKRRQADLRGREEALDREVSRKTQDLESRAERLAKEDAFLNERKAALEAERQAHATRSANDELAFQRRNEALSEREASLSKREQTVALREGRVEAFRKGIQAFVGGKLVGAIQQDGAKKLTYKDADALKECAPGIRPAYDLVWTFVKDVALRVQAIEGQAEEKARQLIQDALKATRAFAKEWEASSGVRRQALSQRPAGQALQRLAQTPVIAAVLPKASAVEEPSLAVLAAMAERQLLQR